MNINHKDGENIQELGMESEETQPQVLENNLDNVQVQMAKNSLDLLEYEKKSLLKEIISLRDQKDCILKHSTALQEMLYDEIANLRTKRDAALLKTENVRKAMDSCLLYYQQNQ